MSFTLTVYRKMIDDFFMLMESSADIASIKLSEDKWTLAEMTGHLIDSASNNHQRFIRLQLEPALTFPAYDAEDWRKASKISGYGFVELAGFWKQYNLFLLHLIANMDEACLSNYWQIGDERKTLRFLVEDYYAHLAWHLRLFDERIGEIRSVS